MGQKVLHAIFDDPEATLKEAAAVLGGGLAGVEQAEVLRDKSIVEEQLKKEQGRYEIFINPHTCHIFIKVAFGKLPVLRHGKLLHEPAQGFQLAVYPTPINVMTRQGRGRYRQGSRTA